MFTILGLLLDIVLLLVLSVVLLPFVLIAALVCNLWDWITKRQVVYYGNKNFLTKKMFMIFQKALLEEI